MTLSIRKKLQKGQCNPKDNATQSITTMQQGNVVQVHNQSMKLKYIDDAS